MKTFSTKEIEKFINAQLEQLETLDHANERLKDGIFGNDLKQEKLTEKLALLKLLLTLKENE